MVGDGRLAKVDDADFVVNLFCDGTHVVVAREFYSEAERVIPKNPW